MTVSRSHRWHVLVAIALTSVVAMSRTVMAGEATTPAQVEEQGFWYYHGHTVPVDLVKAATLFEQGAKAGRPVSQWMLARMHVEGHGVAKNLPRAFELAQGAATQGLPAAQSLLGWMYLSGYGVARDPMKAAHYFSAAAQQGDAPAFYQLATMYRTGNGVTADADFSFRLLTRSAELGNITGMTEAAMVMLYGASQERDVGRGVHYLRIVAERKDQRASYLLARIYLSERLGKRQLAEAARWMAQAAESGSMQARFWLSEMHARGLGFVADPVKSETLLEQARVNATASEINSFAWDLAVTDDAALRDGVLALRLMQRLGKILPPDQMDTLAAAFAEVGDFPKAIDAQLAAIDALPKRQGIERTLKGMQERLQLYRDGKAFHLQSS
jgi:TPR repeat protein